MLQPFDPVGLVRHQGEAERVEGLALIEFCARSRQGARGRGEAAEPVEEQRLPAKPLPAFAQQGQGRVDQPLVRRLAQAQHAEPHEKGRTQFADIGGAEAVQGVGQGLDLGDQLQASGQLGQVPEHRLRLAGEGVKAGLVEIGGGEARLIGRQEAPGAIVETLARDVQIVGVEHPVDETRRDPARGQSGRGLDDGAQQAGRVPCRDLWVIQAADVRDQRFDLIDPPQIGRPLEGSEPDMGVRQPHQDRRTGRRRLVAPLQRLAGLDQGEGAAGRNPQGLQHRGRQNLAHPAFQGQPTVAAARPGRLARSLGSQIQQTGPRAAPRSRRLRRLPHLGRQKAAPVAQVGVVVTELMAVIAHRQRPRLARQGFEPAEGGDPFGLAQPVQPHLGGGALIAETQIGLGKARGLHGVGEVRPQIEKDGSGAVVGVDGHGGQLRPPGRFRKARTRR